VLADRLPELAEGSAAIVRNGATMRARIVGLADEAAARRLCEAVTRQGSACFVLPPNRQND
jgi:hypothetical protein